MTTLNQMDPLLKIYSETESIRLSSGTPMADRVVTDIFAYTEKLAKQVVLREDSTQKAHSYCRNPF